VLVDVGIVMLFVWVLYVGGVLRSGSTLIDLVFDQLFGYVVVGELFYFFCNGV